MELVAISEFIHLTGLSHRDLCGLLEDGQLKTSTGPNGELLVDIDSFPDHLLAYRAPEKHAEIENDVIAQFDEHMAAELLHQLDDIVIEAVELAANWLGESRDDSSK